MQLRAVAATVTLPTTATFGCCWMIWQSHQGRDTDIGHSRITYKRTAFALHPGIPPSTVAVHLC
jgi:hypothetical protein